MWIKRKEHVDPVDVEIVRNGFLICEGSTLKYTFLHEKDKNPFGRGLLAPVLYLFKIHKDHPMRVQVSELNHVYIYPEKDFQSRGNKKGRMPAEVYQDKMAWDITTFLMVPFTEEEGNFGGVWNKYKIPDGFKSDSGDVKDSTLLYIDRGDIHTQDSLNVVRVMPSQVVPYLNSWMYDGREITSHEHTFEQRLEGKVSVPNGTRGNIWPDLVINLEKNYKTKLLSQEYRDRLLDK